VTKAYAPVLLERKAARIRKSMDEEKARGITIRTAMDATDRQCVRLIFIAIYAYISKSWKAVLSKALVRPFKLFIYEPIVQLLGLYLAFIYGLLYRTYSESLPYMPSYTFQCFLRPYQRRSKTCITTEWASRAFTISLLVLVFRSHHRSTRG
jgi:hypothetical protein